LSIAAGVRGSRLDSVATTAGPTDRDYIRATLEINWAMTPRWHFTTGLDRVSEEFLEAGGVNAVSNGFSIGIRYEGLSQQQPQQRQR
jgi:hypothetical protein